MLGETREWRLIRNNEMHCDQFPYRELLGQLDNGDESELETIISRWLTAHAAERAWVEALGQVRNSGIPAMTLEGLWRLYALSRVADALIKLVGEDHRRVPHYVRFMEGLGLRKLTTDCYHPFYHEAVTVTPSANADAPIKMTGLVWPGFMCGPLMIIRAGVSVTGGARHIRKDVAETSTLYWCYRRAGRPTEDLSLGWGSNSQWRTRFRRDYCLEGQYWYNVDGDNKPGDPALEGRERLELLRHRCFMVTNRAHTDLFPYGYRHSEPIA